MPNSIIIIWFGYIGGTGDDLIYGRDGQDCLQGGAENVVQFSTMTHDHIHFQRGGNDLCVFTDDDIATRAGASWVRSKRRRQIGGPTPVSVRRAAVANGLKDPSISPDDSRHSGLCRRFRRRRQRFGDGRSAVHAATL